HRELRPDGSVALDARDFFQFAGHLAHRLFLLGSLQTLVFAEFGLRALGVRTAYELLVLGRSMLESGLPAVSSLACLLRHASSLVSEKPRDRRHLPQRGGESPADPAIRLDQPGRRIGYARQMGFEFAGA